jgi:hypothetical protein
LVKEPSWETFDTVGNRKGRYDHITQSQMSKGGSKGGTSATLESHGEQLGNCGRKSST